MISSTTYFSSLSNFRKPISIFLAFLLYLGNTACGETPTFTPPTLAVLSIQETYSQAESIAKTWQRDAQLNSADFNIIINSSSNNFRCSYVFLSPSSHKYLIVFVRITDSGYGFETTEGLWPADRPIGTAISFEEIHLESQKALNIIMESGGNTFFERYRVREKRFMDSFFLQLERLDNYKGQGPVIWTGTFAIDNPHAQLHISIEDETGDLLKVRAYGEKEQEYWLRDITVTEKIPIGKSKNFFELFDLRLDDITEENGTRYADFTIIAPKIPWLIRGETTYIHAKQGSTFSFGVYEITLIGIEREWIEIEIMPIDKWYKPTPID